MTDQVVTPSSSSFFHMLENLLAIATISTEQIEQLAGLLDQQVGALSEKRLDEIVAECIDDPAQGEATVIALLNLRACNVDQVLNNVSDWRESDEQHRQQFSDDSFKELQQKLPLLIREYGALDRRKKVEKLHTFLGNELQGVAFVCDARPVYNNQRDCIEGLIPLTTMKIIYERQNLDKEEVEIFLTEEQLDNLISQAQQAKQKLTVLCNSTERWIPNGCFNEEKRGSHDH